MADSIFNIFVSFDSTIGIASVLLINVRVENQIVCFKIHQRGNVKKGNNIGIVKSFFKSMRVIWAILSHLKKAHINLILASAVNMVIIGFYMGRPNK